MVWCLFIQHQRTSYIAQITHDAEREMHEVYRYVTMKIKMPQNHPKAIPLGRALEN